MKIYILDKNDKKSQNLMGWLYEIVSIDEVRLFEDGAEFTRQVIENHPDSCIIRLGFPGISGLKTADTIQKEDNTIRIIFISDNPDYAVDAYEIGAHGYLLSPVDKVKLLNCIYHNS